MSIKGLITQFMKFGVVGVIAFAIDYGVLMLLSQLLGMDPVVAAAISFTVSVVFNYLASMKYVFTHREGMSRRREFVTFVILSVIGLGINELINGKQVVDVQYVNTLGMQSSEPFDGVNIVITRYSDGSTSTTKVVK